ncbi:MAG: PDZ domain-containing protein [Deltaproteobacteria bacterium]|nr:PDZ domain-containing protein [Deltaproteobacteria bacterium]
MNLRTLQPFLIFAFLIITAFITADMVNTMGQGAMQALPGFKIPDTIKRKEVAIQTPVVEGEEEAAVSTPSEALPPIKLLGTITGAFPYAVVLDLAGNKQELYRLRNDVGSGWLIDEIEKNRVVLTRGEIKEVLEVKFIEAEPKAEVGAGLKPAPTGTGIRLDSRDVEGALSDLNKVMTQARVVPNMVEGKTSGYRIFNIAPASIYTKLGLQNNDVVERVNGVEIKSPDALYQLFQQIKNERKIALDFNRGGRRESVNIEIK